jgi:hypothetical protein
LAGTRPVPGPEVPAQPSPSDRPEPLSLLQPISLSPATTLPRRAAVPARPNHLPHQSQAAAPLVGPAPCLPRSQQARSPSSVHPLPRSIPARSTPLAAPPASARTPLRRILYTDQVGAYQAPHTLVGYRARPICVFSFHFRFLFIRFLSFLFVFLFSFLFCFCFFFFSFFLKFRKNKLIFFNFLEMFKFIICSNLKIVRI